MRTRFDHLSDDAITDAVERVQPGERYPEQESNLRRIAYLAYWMFFWKCWLGPFVTVFSDKELDYDGHHRTRAVKWIARVKKFQIQVPVRFSCDPKD